MAHGSAVCCVGKGMAPGHGSGRRLLCGGAVRIAERSTQGSWRTGREVPRQWWWFPLPRSDHPEQGRKGLPLGENRKSCEISMHVSAEAVPVHTCPHLPFEPAQLPDIYLCLCCRAGLVGFTITEAF